MPRRGGVASARSATSGPARSRLGEWQALGLELPDLAALRAYRLARVRAQLAARDCAGIVVTDPINIRYTTDAANMQVWCLHNAARYAFVATEGPIVLFDFHGCAHLAEPLRAGRRGAAGARLVLFPQRPAPRRARRAVGGRARRSRARPWRRQPPPCDRQGRPGGRRRPREAGSRPARRPGDHGAGARDQVARRDQGHALRARGVRGGDGHDAGRAASGHDRAGALGAAPCREHQARRRVDRDPAALAPVRVPIPGSRSAAAG